MYRVGGMDDINATVAANVRAAVARHQISQAALAEALELSRTSVYQRLNGKARFTVVELAKVADLTGLDITEFFRVAPTSSSVA